MVIPPGNDGHAPLFRVAAQLPQPLPASAHGMVPSAAQGIDRPERPAQSTARLAAAGPPRISWWLRFLFHGIARRRIRRAFRALRVSNIGRLPSADTPDLLVCLNHPSWWDPLVGFVLSPRLFPGRRFYAPMDAVSLRRYGVLRRLGIFPVAMDSPRGAAQFLHTATTVLDAGHILAVTPQGQFTDVRVRPVELRPGLAALLHRRVRQGVATTVVPLAIEYTFWDQRQPEALVNCGDPLRFGPNGSPGESSDATPNNDPAASSQAAIQTALEAAMTRAQDELAALSLRRDPQHFQTVLEGRRGSSGFYGILERLRALRTGQPAAGDHRAVTPRTPQRNTSRNS